MGQYEEEAAGLALYMLRKYYCENDVEAVIKLLDDELIWLGTGESELAVGGETVTCIFRRFAGQVPPCNISDEECHVLALAPDAFLCSGRVWIATDASTGISLRVHQRFSLIFRRKEGQLRCCHIHISNPYSEMMEEDEGFPTHMARQSYEYLQEQIRAEKQQIAAQTETLRRMSFEDTLTGVYNRNRFNHVLSHGPGKEPCSHVGIACFDLNGLKEVNDHNGHSAGDKLIRQTAEQLQHLFPRRVYRTGGDEFVIVDDQLEKASFEEAVSTAKNNMEAAGISCSVGSAWQPGQAELKRLYDQADSRMYEEKRRYYSCREHDRRNRR